MTTTYLYPSKSDPCPCGSKKMYADCCAPLHGGAPAASAEALMRSRYSAFVLGLNEYIAASWHASTRPPAVAEEIDSPHKTHWLRLQIARHERIDASHALVEFIARYKRNGCAYALHEISRFVHERGHWYYLDGDIR